MGFSETLLDSPVPDIKVSTLTPSKYKPAVPKRTYTNKVRSKINDFAEWILKLPTYEYSS